MTYIVFCATFDFIISSMIFLCFLPVFDFYFCCFTGQDLKDKRAEATTFEELLLIDSPNVSLDGIEPINGSEAYVIKNGKSKMYYDVKSGLKVAENVEIGDGDKKMTITKNYNEYRDLNGIKFPYQLIINQNI